VPPRLTRLDAARGAALLPMALYHGAWDLSVFGWIEADVAAGTGWTLLARATTIAFLVIAGMGLALATRAEQAWRRALRRVLRIAAAAGLVSLGTWWFAPENMVLFGILHAIALGSLLAWPLRRAPGWLLLALAAAAIALPALVRDAAFAGGAWTWFGLSPEPSIALDHVPLLPWWGCLLLGLVAGRSLPEAERGAPGVLTRLAAWAGRHSLAIYLLHQPLFIGALMLTTEAMTASPAALEAAWREAFRAECLATGEQPQACDAYAACALERLAPQEGLLRAASRKRMSEAQRVQFEGALGICEMQAAAARR
jgi:uncharacterized membrane protein